MLPNAYIHHQLPSRLRLYIPSKKDNDEFFKKVHSELSECSEIDGIKVNSKTGSILIYFHGDLAKIIEFAKQASLFIIKEKMYIKKNHHTSAKKIFKNINILNRKIVEQSEGQIDLAFITACGLTGLALFQAKNGRMLPPSWALISQAFTVLHLSAGGQLAQLLSQFEEEEADV